MFQQENGALRVFASRTIGNYLLPAMIARYRRDYPSIPF